MATPSRATGISFTSFPWRLRACILSFSFMGRDDSQTSVPPLISAAIPVPDPPPVTWILTPGLLCIYVSAQRCPRITMVSDPLMVIGFDLPPDPETPPQPIDPRMPSVLTAIRNLIFIVSPLGKLQRFT